MEVQQARRKLSDQELLEVSMLIASNLLLEMHKL